MSNESSPVELVPAVTVASEFHTTRRTIGRWFVTPAMNFPQPISINSRLYFRRSEIEAWKLSRAVAPAVKTAEAR
jgi:predicted DNA-binding transcriptional regulator AlpA